MANDKCGAGRVLEDEHGKCDMKWLETSLGQMISKQFVEATEPATSIEPPPQSVNTEGQPAVDHLVQLHFSMQYEDTLKILKDKKCNVNVFCGRAFEWLVGHYMYNQSMRLQETISGGTMVTGEVALTQNAVNNAAYTLRVYGHRPLRFTGHSDVEWSLSSWMITPLIHQEGPIFSKNVLKILMKSLFNNCYVPQTVDQSLSDQMARCFQLYMIEETMNGTKDD